MIFYVAHRFRSVDRLTAMLLPPDLRDWLPDDHLAWLVLEVVDQLDLDDIRGDYRLGGAGRQAFDPALLTAVLLYAYCVGLRSSRAIERACVTDVALRVIAAQQRPDHCTISRFRARHSAQLAGLLGQVLTLCGRAGMGQVGIVAVDGTKIAANASRAATLPEGRLRQLAEEALAEAAQADADEDERHGPDRGDELPAALAPGADRAERIRRALADIDAERAAQAAPSVQSVQAGQRRLQRAMDRRAVVRERVAQRGARWRERDRALREQRGTGMGGVRPVDDPDQHVLVRRADDAVRAAEEHLEQVRAGRRVPERVRQRELRRNLTDPDSRVMPTRGKGFIQGYNAQIAVSDDHLIVATDITQDTNDKRAFIPMIDPARVGADALTTGRRQGGHHEPEREHTIGVLVADAGYYSSDNLTRPGPDRLIALGRDPAHSRAHADPPAQMAARLQPDHPDRAIYNRRAATVEPVIGQLKDRLRLRRFSRRGLQAVRDELALTATAFNILRLHATT
jgi:transposase